MPLSPKGRPKGTIFMKVSAGNISYTHIVNREEFNKFVGRKIIKENLSIMRERALLWSWQQREAMPPAGLQEVADPGTRRGGCTEG